LKVSAFLLTAHQHTLIEKIKNATNASYSGTKSRSNEGPHDALNRWMTLIIQGHRNGNGRTGLGWLHINSC